MEVKIEQNVKKVNPKKMTYKYKMNKAERAALWGKRIFLWISILIVIFPIFAIITASLSPGTSFMQKTLIPKEISLVNYKVVLSAKDGFLKWMLNTTFVALAVSTIQLIMTMPAAYAFSKMRFTGRKNGLMTLLILQMFPSSMAVPAILAIAYKVPFGMDNLWFLVLVLCAGSAYNIWLMKGFIDGLPQALDEAAMVDGATSWQVFTKIILPLSKPMAVVIFFFSFISIYGEFIFSAALIKEKSLKLLVPGLKSLMVDKVTNWPQYAAASILISIPLAIVFVCIQKFITRGLVAGSIKE
ncbi:sugar ABC transporter permease [Clostridium sp. 'White wine YQ']|uniref:sugar ABC transporter permease n=1 Tax=Clostridium sp. 'White wine YQ' TaxID=3027474 RepID=UPI0023672319|nr:ABC transporter permease subunit [Clostridium sp. 'White wine YQ']MDD7794438.1 ABC transporter permease subunit [Clostridium sp. 'White wine YQ']